MPTSASMLPAGNSPLSETLNYTAPLTATPVETEGTRLKYLKQKIAWPKRQPKSAEDRRPSTETPRYGDSDEFPAIPTAYYFADYVLSSDKVSLETKAFVHIIQQVRSGINEAKTLYLSATVSSFLDAYPSKRSWIEGSLQEAQRVLNDIGMEMDAAWVHDEDGGTVASKCKLEWGLKNQKKLLKKHQQLNQCHAQLTGAIHVMQTAELCGKPGVIPQEAIFEAPVRPWVPQDERNALRGPYSRQKRRVGHSSPSMSNLTLSSEAEKDEAETISVNSAPVELAGSTPSDVPANLRMETFLSPQASRDHFAISAGLTRRQRASSDYIRPAFKRELRARASIYVASPSSTLADTTLGRYDSTASIEATVGIPMIAKRYRATSVDIPRHTERHRLLPLELPRVKNEPSLLDDLAGFVHSRAEGEEVPSETSITSPTWSVPSISVTSTATIENASSAVSEEMLKSDMVTKSMLQPIKRVERAVTAAEETHQEPQNFGHNQRHDSSKTMMGKKSWESLQSQSTNLRGADCTPQPIYQHSWPSNTSLSSNSTTNVTIFEDDEPACRPSSQRPSRRMAKRTSRGSSSVSVATAPSPTISTIIESEPQPFVASLEINSSTSEDTKPTRLPQPSPVIVVDDASQPILANPNEMPEDLHDDDIVLSVLRERLRKHARAKSLTGGLDDDNVVLSVLRERLRKHTQTKSLAQTLVRESSAIQPVGPSTGTRQLILARPTLKEPVTSVRGKGKSRMSVVPLINVENATPLRLSSDSREPGGNRSMSAQARRRTAHARRMKLAFENGVDPWKSR